MKPLPLMGGAVLVVMAWALLGGIRFEEAPQPTLPLDNSATRRGQVPWATNEPFMVEGRRGTRQSTLKTLDQPWSAFCGADGHQRLLSSLQYYYEQRAVQEHGYARAWGEAADRYIRQAWASSDDARIERLTQETYSRGYFNLDDFTPFVRAKLSAIVAGERVSGRPCAP
jgi:hypothetical protein